MKKFTNIKKIKLLKENIEEMNEPVSERGLTTNITVDFFSKLFESRELAHVYHLGVKGDTGSHAAHLALGDYYETVGDLIDELVEVYQGQYDLIEGWNIIDPGVSKDLEPIQYFTEVAEYITENRDEAILPEDTHLQSLVDDIMNILYKLIYKLRFNK
jgi:hypothetical protein